jgi:hypothetical protein
VETLFGSAGGKSAGGDCDGSTSLESLSLSFGVRERGVSLVSCIDRIGPSAREIWEESAVTFTGESTAGTDSESVLSVRGLSLTERVVSVVAVAAESVRVEDGRELNTLNDDAVRLRVGCESAGDVSARTGVLFSGSSLSVCTRGVAAPPMWCL